MQRGCTDGLHAFVVASLVGLLALAAFGGLVGILVLRQVKRSQALNWGRHKKQGDSQKVQDALSRKVKDLRENKIKLEETYVYQRYIDAETYQSMRAKLAE